MLDKLLNLFLGVLVFAVGFCLIATMAGAMPLALPMGVILMICGAGVALTRPEDF